MCRLGGETWLDISGSNKGLVSSLGGKQEVKLERGWGHRTGVLGCLDEDRQAAERGLEHVG